MVITVFLKNIKIVFNHMSTKSFDQYVVERGLIPVRIYDKNEFEKSFSAIDTPAA